MTDKELNLKLRELAMEHDACNKVMSQWKEDDTIDILLDRYVRTFDFAVEKDYPPLSFIRENFRRSDLHGHHIYIDEEVDITGENGYYVFLGRCTGEIVIDGLHATTIYIRHDSNVNVVVNGGARVFITYYDNSTGNVKSDEWSRVKQFNRKNH